MGKQLVLLDEEQETSDDAGHPHSALPPKRQLKRPTPKAGVPRLRIQAEEEVSAQVSPEEAQPSKLRIRDYKSAAERMSKEERKKAGFKRMTAYCIAEGLNMKVLSGFLKREHNVLPRIFDEALYAMYHLPLLPGYGPQTNVRSSAPPPQPISASGTAPAFTKSILTRLEEAEETGYQGTYFPSQDLIDLGETAETHHHQADGFVTDDGGPQGESASHLPGWVQPAEVDEVREHDGYVSSSSLPREQNVLASHPDSEFAYDYNPYPSSSSASSDRSTLRKQTQYFPDHPVEGPSDADHTDSGVETDDHESPDMAASIMTAVPTHWEQQKGKEVSGPDGAELENEECPPIVRASTLPINEGIAALVSGTEEANDLVQDELHNDGLQHAPSAYEKQLEYEREREEDQVEAALQQERLRQVEYEQALEREEERERVRQLDNVGEVVFFDYGVVVFFGLTEREERDILDDIQQAGVLQRPINEEEFEVEECHFAHDPNISYPRIYNDFFTLKSRSHLLKLSIAHALAQSTLLARYETIAQRTLSSPLTLSIPRQMASTGGLQLRRHEALKLTGRLFKLRRDVNLVSNVLDVPELFWSEASLEDLYDAVRDYMEIGPRVESLNEKLGVASDFLDVIHDHLNNSAMERITWIVIWLIVVAVLVELGEIVARLVVHSTLEKDRPALAAMRALTSASPTPLSKEEALRTLERIMNIQS